MSYARSCSRRLHAPCPLAMPRPVRTLPAPKLGKAQAITKTQARRPRYRMTGIATLTGRFSVAVGTIREASNVIPCIVLLLLAVNPPSPEVVHDRAPVPPGRASWYDHIDTNWPMMFRIASACHSPASRPAPSVQARKRGGQAKNLFQFTMLFEKSKENLEIITWYHKSFSSAPRLSELGRGLGRQGSVLLIWVEI